MAREPFDVEVYWPAGNVNNWPAKGGDFYNKTGIHMYKISKDSWNPFYTYEVKIRTNWPFTYKFYDETGDSYTVGQSMVGMNPDHWVKYNSERPTIVRVTGS